MRHRPWAMPAVDAAVAATPGSRSNARRWSNPAKRRCEAVEAHRQFCRHGADTKAACAAPGNPRSDIGDPPATATSTAPAGTLPTSRVRSAMFRADRKQAIT
jgi:hypothetical protein